MKFAAAVLALASCAAAQSVKACDGKAQACLDTATKNSGICEVGDWYCGCQPENMAKLQGGATSCLLEACGGTAGALGLLSEVEAICKEALKNPPKPEEPKPEEPKPEEPKPEEPKPEKPKPEEPKPEEPKPDKPKPTYPPKPTVTPPTDDCHKCNGTSPKPAPSHVTAGAAFVAPVSGLLVGLAALIL